jgi:hypothetical protein
MKQKNLKKIQVMSDCGLNVLVSLTADVFMNEKILW